MLLMKEILKMTDNEFLIRRIQLSARRLIELNHGKDIIITCVDGRGKEDLEHGKHKHNSKNGINRKKF